jgi:outer membrane protein TolC
MTRRFLPIAMTLLLSLMPLSGVSQEVLVGKMEANNLEVQKAREEWRNALLDVKDAKAGRGPTIDLTLSGTYMYNPPVGPVYVSTQDLLQQLSDQGMDVSGLSGYQDAYLKIYDGMENTLYTFSLNITQPIFTWGKISNAISLYEKVAEVRSLQITALSRKQKSELLGRLDAVYYLRAMQDLVGEQTETANRLLEIITSARDNGMALDVDVLKASIKAQQTAIGMQQLETELSSQLVAIQTLCGDPTLTLDDLSATVDESAVDALLSQGQDTLVAKATSPSVDNLAILLKLKEVAQLATKISSASVNWKPDFALQTTIGYGGSRFPLLETDWYRQDDYTLNFTVAVKSTIWDGGKKIRDVSRSQTKAEGAEVDYSQAVEKIRSQVITQYLQLQLDGQKIAYQNLVIDGDKQDWEQKQQQQESGYGSEQDTLTAKLQWQTDRMELLKVLLDRNSAFHALSYLAGQ